MKRQIFLIIFSIILTGLPLKGQKSESAFITITKADLEKAGSAIPASAIGEPVGSVKLYNPRWVEAGTLTAGYGIIEGSIFPADPNGWPINFRVLLPASWARRSVQAGGGGFNGVITVREGKNPLLDKGFVMYGSDSGHQGGMGGGAPLATGPAGAGPDDWTLNDEAIKNIGYMQMKKTHDAAMAIIEMVYGQKPLFNYWVGGSQGGREGLTVAQRYPADYDGIIADVPIVNFSTLMLAPELIRIQEKPLANWVTPAKINAIRAEFLRQCDKLDGISDGIINNYIASRAIFDVTDGKGPSDPWKALRAPGGKDPYPDDNTASARLSDGQIKTLEFIYSPYKFANTLANDVKSFGMWLPNIEPDGFRTIVATRFPGQEGAEPTSAVHTSLGVLGVTGFMMKNPKANPLDFREEGAVAIRRKQISEWLDATNPDLSAFYKRGGKIIMTIGTQDFVASSGAQLDYYQSLKNKMGQNKLDEFARLYVVPQGGHGLSGKSYSMNGDGKPVEVKNIPSPNQMDRVDLLIAWVEKGTAPGKTLTVTAEGRISSKPEGKGYLLCSYPEFPKYVGGDASEVSSYKSSLK
jgi:pimeloyl-ACP methyl ester carboxylesterase